jgi:hypothetical protein
LIDKPVLYILARSESKIIVVLRLQPELLFATSIHTSAVSAGQVVEDGTSSSFSVTGLMLYQGSSRYEALVARRTCDNESECNSDWRGGLP